MRLQPRSYQQAAIDKTYEAIISGKGVCPVIELPTGTGKSIVVAGIIEKFLANHPTTRFLMMSHVKELIEQNAEKMRNFCPGLPVGICSGGMGSHNTSASVIFGTVGTVVNKVASLGARDIIIIDECHLVSERQTTMYQKIIADVKITCPHVSVIGLTATPFRGKIGEITNNGIFNAVSFSALSVKCYRWFIENRFMAPLIPAATGEFLDASEVSITNGEFNLKELQNTVDKYEKTYPALQELIKTASKSNRQSWLIFAAGVEHAKHIAEILITLGIRAGCIHSDTKKKERASLIAQFKAGELTCMVNNNVLTTGFDHPGIDLIGVLRHTLSVSLWVQMLGRGTRPFYEQGKSDCLVLDFCGNTDRLGTIDDPNIPSKSKKKKGPSEAPVRICENCNCYNHASVKVCGYCGYEFPINQKIKNRAGIKALMKSMAMEEEEIETFNVLQVNYTLHRKLGSPDSMKVIYFCSGNARFTEYICLDHEGFARTKANQWWSQRLGYSPGTTAESLKLAPGLKQPRDIRVSTNKKYPTIVGYAF